MHRAGQSLYRQGFSKTGNAFQQNVSLAEQAQDEAGNEFLLTHYNLADFQLNRGDPSGTLHDFFSQFLCFSFHMLPIA